MLMGRNFAEIDEGSICSLVSAGVPESVHLDFKRETYGNADADKKEFLKDISAFANTLGGYLLIGVDELEGAASAIMPVGSDVDQELLRLENIARTGIEPKLLGLRFKRVDVSGGSVIVVHVPRSFNPPHRIIFKNSNRYFARHSGGAYELSLEELRMLFGEQRSLEERARRFVGERFLRLEGNDGVMPMPIEKGVLVLNLVPLLDFGANRRIALSAITAQPQNFSPLGSSGYSWRVNLEGFCVYRNDGQGQCHGYTQVFRDGSVEATSASMFPEHDGVRSLPSRAFPPKICSALTSYLSGLRSLDVSPPFLLQISATGIAGVKLAVNSLHIDSPVPYDREVLHLPPSFITDYHVADNYEAIVAEQMHSLWNAFGFEQCSYFDSKGCWIGG